MRSNNMPTKIFTFKITYDGCDGKIWRTAAVSSNYTLGDLGCMILATFDTKAYHLFEMRCKSTTYFLSEEDFEDLPGNADNDFKILWQQKLKNLNISIGDRIEMTYDYGCNQIFIIELLQISDMPKGHGRAYPEILDGAGKGIVDDMPADELLEAIEKTDKDGHSGVYYSSIDFGKPPEWDYRDYLIDIDNMLLKGRTERIRNGFKDFEE